MNAAAWVTLVVAVAALAAVTAGTALHLRRRRSFLARAQTAPAVITGIRSSAFGLNRGATYFAGVTFTTRDGRPVATEVRVYTMGMMPRLAHGVPARSGQRIWVDYDPVDPRRAELNTRATTGPGGPSARPTGVVVLAAVMGVAMVALVGLITVTAFVFS